MEVKLKAEKEIFYENMIVDGIIYSKVRTEYFGEDGTVNIEWILPPNGQLSDVQLNKIYENSKEGQETLIITAKSESEEELFFDKHGNLI